MRDITLSLDRIGAYALMLGRVGENRATQVTIDLSGILSSYPDALGSITVRRPDGKEYPAVASQADGMLTWVVTSADIGDKPGPGAAQITVRSADGTIIKTAIATTRVAESLGSPQTPAPEPVQAWVESAAAQLKKVIQAGIDAASAAKSAEIATESCITATKEIVEATSEAAAAAIEAKKAAESSAAQADASAKRAQKIADSIAGGGSGLTTAVKQYIISLFSQAAYANDSMQKIYNALKAAWGVTEIEPDAPITPDPDVPDEDIAKLGTGRLGKMRV